MKKIIFAHLLIACLTARSLSAAPALIRADQGGIHGFELSYGGFFWWDANGECGGEFPNVADVQFTGTKTANGAPKLVAEDCAMMLSGYDTAARDEAYAYFFAGRQLRRKALSAATADASELVATPPLSPTLAVGQQGSPLEIRGRTLFFARHNNTTGLSEIYSWNLDGTNAVKEGEFDANSHPVSIKYFEYTTLNNPVVRSLAVVTENNRLYRIKLNPVRNEPPTELLATGVNYIAVRTGGFGLANTYIFATKGGWSVMGQIPSGVPGGRLYQVNPETGAETLLYTAQSDNELIGVAATGHDSQDDTYLFVAEGIVSGPSGGFQSITEVALRRHSAKVLTGPWDTIALQGGGWNLRSDGQQLYFLRTNAIFAIPTGSPALQLDIRAVGLEAVQAIQSYNHAVPLVANRPIWVRGYASLPLNTTGQDEWFVTAELRGFLNGNELPGGPLIPINDPGIHTVGGLGSMRASFTNSFLFELPKEWTKPGPAGLNFLNFELTVNRDLALPETVNAPLENNTFTSLPALLVRGNTPCLVMTPVYSVGPEYDAWEDTNFTQIIERAKSIMPVEDFEIFPFSIAAGDPDDPLNFQYMGSTASDPDEAAEENRLYRSGQWGDANDQAEDLGSESDLCDTDDIHYVAMVHRDAVVTPPGGVGERPGNAIAITMGGGRVVAHELGHNYGRKHVECGDFPEDQADFDDIPFPGSLGNPNADLPQATFGFDPLTLTIYRPTDACDIMGYGSVSWPTAYYWNGLLEEINDAAAFAGPGSGISLAASGSGLVLLARGRIYTNSAGFRHFSVRPESEAPQRVLTRSRNEALEAAQNRPPYFLRQLDAAGRLLAETPILPRHPSIHEHTRPEWSFSQYVDFDPRARILRLTRENTVLAERFISPNAPQLRVGAPVIDAANQTVTLNWTANDADGDPLRFSIHYSANDGVRWRALKTDYRALSITIDTHRLPGGTRCRLRVIAHDGVNSTSDVTDPFECPKHAPEIALHGVREGERVPYGQPLRFRAVALDPEDGSALRLQHWSLNGPTSGGTTGNWFTVHTPLPGDYTVRFTAVDSDGQSNSLTRSFEVGPLTIPEAAIAPELDGLPNDAAYGRGAKLQLPGGTSIIPVRLVLVSNYLYASFSGLRYADLLRPNRTVGLRFDVNASRNAAAAEGDVGFFVDEDGVPFQETGQGGSMTRSTQPKPGFTAIIHRANDRWNAEFQIHQSLVGGWNHLAGLMVAHSTSVWPPPAETHQPVTWGPIWPGGGSIPAANKPPVARAGSDFAVALNHATTLTLNGGSSFDPEAAVLKFSWQQVAGPTVALAKTNTPYGEFTAPVALASTTYRFRLIVHDGLQPSAPDDVTVVVRPPPTPQIVVVPKGFAQWLDDGKAQVRLVADPNVAYRLQTSTDLINWQVLRTVAADYNGAIDFTFDPKAFPDPVRFFRAVSP